MEWTAGNQNTKVSVLRGLAKTLKWLLLLVLSTLSLAAGTRAQIIQKAHCAAAATCGLLNPVVPGDMVVVIEGLSANSPSVVADDQGDIFNQIQATGWAGAFNPGPLWYATGVVGGPVNIQLNTTVPDVFVAEYPPAQLDRASSQAFLCCSPSSTIGPLSTTNPDELLIAWVIFYPSANLTLPASAGFTVEDTGSVVVEDREVVPGTYSATIPAAAQPWGAKMVSFTLIGPTYSKFKAPYSPVQIKQCTRGPDGFVLPCQFDQPVGQGNSIFVAGTYGCGPAGCNSVSDSQSNTWSLAETVPYFNGIPLWYALNAKGGTDTIFFAPGTGQTAIIAEYPPSLGLDGANFGTFAAQNLNHPQGLGDNVGWSLPVQTTNSCDLLISWGNSGAQLPDTWKPDPGPNFTVRAAEYGQLVIEDATSGVPGIYISSIKWNAMGSWELGLAAFKMNGCK